MSGKNKISKRGKSGKLSTLQRIAGIGPATEKRFKEVQKKLRDLKASAKRRGVEVPFSLPRVTSFEEKEDVLATIRNAQSYLKNPIVTRHTKKTEQLPAKLIEEEIALVKKLNRPIKAFQERISGKKITINGKEQQETVREYLEKNAVKRHYEYTEQYRFLNAEELKARVKELKKLAKVNQHLKRSKNAKESYIQAFEEQGLASTPEGQKLLKKLTRMSVKRFMDRLATEVNVSFNFVYDDNIEVEGRIDTLVKAWG